MQMHAHAADQGTGPDRQACRRACVCSRGVRVHVQLPEGGQVVHVDAQLRGGDAVCTEERRPASRLGVETAGSAAFNAAPVAAAQLLREYPALGLLGIGIHTQAQTQMQTQRMIF